jgi:hypothetical protein
MGGRFGHDVCLGCRQFDCPAALQPEQQQQRDQQREDAERLGDGEAENQVAELTLRRRRIAQRRRKLVAEDNAYPDAGAAHADTGNTGADIFRGGRIHVKTPS